MENYKKLSEIEAKPIPRLLTGFPELDFVYDATTLPENRHIWGMPDGKISLWAGTSGIGKSRLAIECAKKVAEVGNKVLYFQLESNLSDFASWAKDDQNYDSLYCSGASSLSEIVSIIEEVSPTLVFIDSVNEIEEFSTGNKKETRFLINGDSSVPGLRDVINKVSKETGGCHLVLLGQLNGDGTIKGGTSLPHLVDIALNLTPYTNECKSTFKVNVGIKHRYGRRDDSIYAVFQHTNDGVRCVSENRVCDEKWCNSHGMITYSRGEMLLGRHKGVSPSASQDYEVVSTESDNDQGLLSWLIYGNNSCSTE